MSIDIRTYCGQTLIRRAKAAVLQKISILGCLGFFCMLHLIGAVGQVLADENTNAQIIKTNTLIKGIVTEQSLVQNPSTREYEFTVLRSQDGWYSIQLISQGTNIMAEASSDLVDTIVENAPEEALYGPMPSPEKYTRRVNICSTPYPLCANSMLQVVWLSLCANRDMMSNSISKCPPGILFTYPIRFEPYNIYGLEVENEVYDEQGEGLLREFQLNGPEERLIPESEFGKYAPILKMKSPTRVYDFFGSRTNLVTIPLSLSSSSNRWNQSVFTSFGHFKSTPYPEQSTLMMRGPRMYKLDGSFENQKLFSKIDLKVLSVENEIVKGFFPPVINSSMIMVEDLRFGGLKEEGLFYRIVNKEWPVTGSKKYQEWQSIFVQKSLEETRRFQVPSSSSPARYLTILIVLVAVAPLIVYYIKRRKLK